MPPLALGTVPLKPIPEPLDLVGTEYRFHFVLDGIDRGGHHGPDRLPRQVHPSLVTVHNRSNRLQLCIVEIEFVAECRHQVVMIPAGGYRDPTMPPHDRPVDGNAEDSADDEQCRSPEQTAQPPA